MSFVLDASLTLSWFFEDETNEYARSVRESLKLTGALVPGLWAVEVANGLIVAERRGRVSPETVERAAEILTRLPISIDNTIAPVSELAPLCRKHNLSAYDALYLRLAIRSAFPMATLDERLDAACRSEGIPRHDPKAIRAAGKQSMPEAPTGEHG